MKGLDVIALGGNAILPAGHPGTIYEQFEITRLTMGQIARVVASGRRVVVTHGNGPIVGNIVLRNEAMRDRIPPMPLGICVADSQGGIGYMIQQVLRNALRAAGQPHDVVTIVTQVQVSADDPALSNPTKPIGPFYSKEEADAAREKNGWDFIEDSKRGFRRVVPSPRPIAMVEGGIIRRMTEEGMIVIAAGGGGIPVIMESDQLDGVEAVVDKDYACAVLARDLEAERMIIVTDVDAVYRDYGTDEARPIPRMTAAEAKKMAASLPKGSMGPKLEAAAGFVDAGKGSAEAIITRPADVRSALDARAGTRITWS